MKTIVTILALIFGMTTALAAEQFVVFNSTTNSVCLTDMKGEIVCDKKDWKGVHIAVDNLKEDLRKVTGRDDFPIIVGTLGRSSAIDKLARKKIMQCLDETLVNKFHADNMDDFYLAAAGSMSEENARQWKTQLEEHFGVKCSMSPIPLSLGCHLGYGIYGAALIRKMH